VAVTIRGKRDPYLDQFAAVLEKLVADYPQADVTLRRTNPASIRVRVIDPSFQRMSKTRRDDRVWKYLKQIPEDVLSHLSMVLAFTPDEAETSPVNYDFEHPIRMRI
jgi:hypothetical protein